MCLSLSQRFAVQLLRSLCSNFLCLGFGLLFSHACVLIQVYRHVGHAASTLTQKEGFRGLFRGECALHCMRLCECVHVSVFVCVCVHVCLVHTCVRAYSAGWSRKRVLVSAAQTSLLLRLRGM